MSNKLNTIAISPLTKDCSEKANLLSQQLDLPVTEITNNTFDYLLVVTPTHLELRKINSSITPLSINFLEGALNYRLINKNQKELLAKAVIFKTKEKISVLDTTAGLGRDGFLLASLGCKVLMLERSPIIAALLADGLQRALADPQFSQFDIQLKVIDAINYLKNLTEENYPDVIYLDPMYPERRKSALVKKEMQYLQALVGNDTDTTTLLALSLTRAKKRVVVKRHITAASLQGPKPHHIIKGKNTRFDVYMPNY